MYFVEDCDHGSDFPLVRIYGLPEVLQESCQGWCEGTGTEVIILHESETPPPNWRLQDRSQQDPWRFEGMGQTLGKVVIASLAHIYLSTAPRTRDLYTTQGLARTSCSSLVRPH